MSDTLRSTPAFAREVPHLPQNTPAPGVARLYYEAHITVEPLDAESFGYSDFVDAIEQDHKNWRASKFEHDDVDNIADKWFLSAKSSHLDSMKWSVRTMLADLRSHGFVIERWKIEEAVLDSKHGDSEETLNV